MSFFLGGKNKSIIRAPWTFPFPLKIRVIFFLLPIKNKKTDTMDFCSYVERLCSISLVSNYFNIRDTVDFSSHVDANYMKPC